MSSIAAGPEVVGEKVAAALVGTFLGIFIGYGIVGPIAKRLEHHYEAGRPFLLPCLKQVFSQTAEVFLHKLALNLPAVLFSHQIVQALKISRSY